MKKPDETLRIIEPKGIQRKFSDLNSPDGACEEVVNRRLKDGAWRPMYPKLLENTYDHGCTDLYYHEPANNDKYIGYHSGDDKVYLVDPDTPSKTAIKTLNGTETFAMFSHLNNILAITTDENEYLLKWDMETSAYVELEEIPGLDVSYVPDDVQDFYSESYGSMKTLIAAQKASIAELHKAGTILEEYVLLRWAFKLFDGSYWKPSMPFMFFSGEEEYPTHNLTYLQKTVAGPFYRFMRFQHCAPKIRFEVISAADKAILEKYAGIIKGITFFMTSPELVYNLQEVDDPGGSTSLYELYGAPGPVEYYYIPGNKAGLEKELEDSLFYEVGFISLDEILDLQDDVYLFGVFTVAGTPTVDGIYTNNGSEFKITNRDYFHGLPVGTGYILMEKISGTNDPTPSGTLTYFSGPGSGNITFTDWSTRYDFTKLSLGDITTLNTNSYLSADNYSHHMLLPKTTYNYNSRRHLGDINTKLSKGYRITESGDHIHLKLPATPSFYPGGVNTTHSYYLYVTLKTLNGDIKYVMQPTTVYCYKDALGVTNNHILIRSVIYYPDPRATNVKLLATDDDITYYIIADLKNDDWDGDNDMKEHKMLTLSYNVTKFVESCNVWWYPHVLCRLYALNATNYDTITPETEDRYVVDKNRVQVSKLNNIFINPADQSYQVGTSEAHIIRIATASAPLSTGQFGQFPLIVFTQEGVYTFEQGIGNVLYASIQPLSKDVLLSCEAVCELGGSIAYATEAGLYILSGSETQHISKDVEGKVCGYLPLNTDYDGYMDDSTLVELTEVISGYEGEVDFLGYISSGCIIAYDHILKELIVASSYDDVSNGKYGYCYVFSIEYKSWYKLTQQFDQFINLYPKFKAISHDGYFYDLHSEDNTETINTLMQTKPLTLGTMEYKKITRAIERSFADIKTSCRSGFYIFGSNNLDEWVMLRGAQFSGDANDYLFNQILEGSRASSRFVIIVSAVHLDSGSDSSISHFEITLQPGTYQKIR